YGGEEFAIVLAQTDLPAARAGGEQIRAALAERPCFFASEEDPQTVITIPITASIGVAIFEGLDMTRESLIQAADGAMYHAKRSGRNRVCVAGEIEPHLYHIAFDETTGEAMTLRALIAAASEYDHDTAEHSKRMIWLAVMTALKLGCSADEVELIRLAAVLHDIGKIGVPHETLRKPGPLTPDEWTIMRRHPDIGRQILQKIGGRFESVSHIVVSHHERWNGEGYPYGLQRDAIPIGARILAVADSYDAMTSRRTYREPLADDAARAELSRCAGEQFDPRVVEAFLQVLDEQEAQRAA
ncbi:MAG TPA: HD domain-containing phosphohydrolase, partial [Ktedonobacterales bacterium]|nr:HD domain-containing phosphohydrolase [Ktedonobacterales bacterium]